MIEKLQTVKPHDSETETVVYENTPLIQKVNELVDAVNEIKTWRFETDDEPAENGKCSKMENVAENGNFAKNAKNLTPGGRIRIDGLDDPYAEQRKWVGCVCRFWFDNPDDTVLDYLGKIQTGEKGIEYYGKETYDWFPHCEPILPTDNAIYKGDDK